MEKSRAVRRSRAGGAFEKDEAPGSLGLDTALIFMGRPASGIAGFDEAVASRTGP